MSREMLNVWKQFTRVLDSAVECWHAGSGDGLELHEYLGLTWAEYQELTGPADVYPDLSTPAAVRRAVRQGLVVHDPAHLHSPEPDELS